MRSLALILLALVPAALAGCADDDTSGTGGTTTGPDDGIEARVAALLGQMTLEEKIEQMHGLQLGPIDDLYWTPDNERLKVPGFRMVDGPRGVRAGKATTFPVGMARGATWDPAIERRVGEAMGEEAAAKGANVLLAPTINTLRHPAWGRAQETYGEDTALLGAMGVAFIQGAQEHVLASAKHLAANSIENSRFTVNVTMDERTLREQYLPHFRRAVEEAHVASVMTAYNKVGGLYCSENPHLLRDVLDGDWAFDGFVESDWVLGTRSTAPAALAGLDIEMPAPLLFGNALLDAVESGEVPESVIDDAVRRILRKKLEFRLDAPTPVDTAVVESAAHVDLAREVEREALVLLKNEAAALPLDAAKLQSLVVVGPLADVVNLGDHGSSDSVPSHAVTPLAGIQERAGNVAVAHVPGPALTAEDEAAIAAADAVIVVAGLTAEDEGEYLGATMPGGGDRHQPDLRLPAEQEALLLAVAAQNPRTIVVLEGGSAIVVRPWVDEVEGLVMAWYPGMEGGHAIADVLFGDASPSGRLPITFPRSVDDLPPFDNESEEVTYGFLHGYRHVDAEGTEPEFPFGFGLSYTTFAYSNLELGSATVPPDGMLSVHVDVTNTGQVAGDEVVQLYVAYQGSAVERAPKDLKAFQRVHLAPAETQNVTLELPARDLAYWDVATGGWVVEPIAYEVHVGPSSRDLPLEGVFSITK